MSAFTAPSGAVLQSLSFYNELQLAYSERKQARGGTAESLFSEGDYWQKLSMYQGWQSWMEGACYAFVDHVSGPLNSDGTDFLYFTLATWRAAAGLNANGFSRYDRDGNFIGYGIAQDDDIICDKTFLELQKGFVALKWAKKSGITRSQSGDMHISATGIANVPSADAWGEAVEMMSSLWGTSSGYSQAYERAVGLSGISKVSTGYHNYGISYLGAEYSNAAAHGLAEQGSAVIASVPTFASGTVDFYVKATKYYNTGGYHADDFNAFGSGFLEDVYVFKGSAAIAGTVVSESLISTTMPEVYDPGYGTCQWEKFYEEYMHYVCTGADRGSGFTVSGVMGLLKYNFTHDSVAG